MKVKTICAAVALTAVAAGAQATLISSSFQVTMKITSTCAVTTAPTNIDLGSAVASSTAVTDSGSTTINVNCSNKTPFFVGLAPSTINGGTNAGIGFMKGATSGNTDLVPYTLYKDSGFTTAWGNTATSTTAGNGMSGTGAGMATAKAVSFIAYAQAVNADFAPDTYTDTVTVNVNY